MADSAIRQGRYHSTATAHLSPRCPDPLCLVKLTRADQQAAPDRHTYPSTSPGGERRKGGDPRRKLAARVVYQKDYDVSDTSHPLQERLLFKPKKWDILQGAGGALRERMRESEWQMAKCVQGQSTDNVVVQTASRRGHNVLRKVGMQPSPARPMETVLRAANNPRPGLKFSKRIRNLM